MVPTHLLRSILSLTLILLSVSAFAGDEAQASGYKIGIVNIKEVFDGYNKQKEDYAALNKEKDAAQKPIDALSKKIEADKKIYDETRDSMTDDERRDMEDRINQSLTEFETEFKRQQQEIDRKEKRIIEDAFRDINNGIQELGLKLNYHLIHQINGPGSSSVVYHSTTLDLTQRVIDHLNDTYAKGSGE